NELVAILGNFVNRVMILMHKFFGGKIETANGKVVLKDEIIGYELFRIWGEIEQNIENYRFRQGMQAIMDIARVGNRYLTEKEPWKTIKTDPADARLALHNCLVLIGHLASAMQPFLPASAEKILKMLNWPEEKIDFNGEVSFRNGHQLNAAGLLFEKVEDSVIEQQIARLRAKKPAIQAAAPQIVPAKENINYEAFAAMDIRIGTIMAAEKVAKTKKLLKLTIDTGLDTRTVVSGIAEHYEPENIIGKKVSLLANLEPREIKGIISQGMILMAEDSEGKLTFVSPQDPFNNGSVVR
ncbi:MAG: methionine--tRNA ligase subunit beta, partial [Bacteroidetes bacterium]|nr:methionine--tRNA ligase subunit beta [Bacteroidota bacterium]